MSKSFAQEPAIYTANGARRRTVIVGVTALEKTGSLPIVGGVGYSRKPRILAYKKLKKTFEIVIFDDILILLISLFSFSNYNLLL